jgi:mono/diheme cytochrome c family protein
VRRLLIVSFLLVAGCAGPVSPRPGVETNAAIPVMAADPVARGKVLVETRCAACHAVGPSGESSLSPAPPFRTLSQRYPVANLQEAFAEGISTGHPQMPQIALEADQVKDLIAYLESVQMPPKSH